VHDLLFDYAIVFRNRPVRDGRSPSALIWHLLILSLDSHHFLLAVTDRWPAFSAAPDVIGRVLQAESNTMLRHLLNRRFDPGY
jgi:hypothetical protein